MALNIIPIQQVSSTALDFSNGDDKHSDYGFVFKDTVTGNWSRPPADIIDV